MNDFGSYKSSQIKEALEQALEQHVHLFLRCTSIIILIILIGGDVDIIFTHAKILDQKTMHLDHSIADGVGFTLLLPFQQAHLLEYSAWIKFSHSYQESPKTTWALCVEARERFSGQVAKYIFAQPLDVEVCAHYAEQFSHGFSKVLVVLQCL